MRPERAKAFFHKVCHLTLLPFQGALAAFILPRALPWAKCFCPFRACLKRFYPNLIVLAKLAMFYRLPTAAVATDILPRPAARTTSVQN